MNARREIQQMRADVDALAKKSTEAESTGQKFFVLRKGESEMVVRLRQLRIGEWAAWGDLWLSHDNRLFPFRPWYVFGRISSLSVPHYRVLCPFKITAPMPWPDPR